MFLHQTIEQLAVQDVMPQKQPLWLYLDPSGQEHLIMPTWSDSDGKANNSPTLRKDTEVHAMTDDELSQLSRQPNPYLLEKYS